jgi:hypothetical protein
MLSSWRMYEMHLALFLKAGCDNWPMEEEQYFTEVSLRCCELRCKDNLDLTTVMLLSSTACYLCRARGQHGLLHDPTRGKVRASSSKGTTVIQW